MLTQEALDAGVAVLVLAGPFLVGNLVSVPPQFAQAHRSCISFGAGSSAAYVFVHVMPELHGARRSFAESVSMPLRYEGMVIYFVALMGFLAFYGLDHMHGRLREAGSKGKTNPAFKLHVGGFAAYVCLMAYLLVHNLGETRLMTALYAAAMSFHFLGVDHALREQHGAAYERIGRYALAAMCIIGWIVGLLVALPHYVLALLVAFVSGGIIMNCAIMELPSEKDGRFLPFLIGGLVYGLILLPLG